VQQEEPRRSRHSAAAAAGPADAAPACVVAAPQVVKRWVNEVQEAVQNRNSMVQFHAVALLHALRATDRLAISKLVTTLTKSNVKSPLAQCLLVRYVSQVRAASGLQAAMPGPPRLGRHCGTRCQSPLWPLARR
jgi:hypothetical protein